MLIWGFFIGKVKKMKMYKVKNLIFFSFLFYSQVQADDLNQIVSGADIEDVLGTMKSVVNDPYVAHKNETGEIENYQIKDNANEDFIFNSKFKEVSVNDDSRLNYGNVGYTVPGFYEKSEQFLEINKAEMAADFRKLSSSGLNISFIKDDFSYESSNDIINKTISEGHKHLKGGALHLRNDHYINRTSFLNTFLGFGAGVGYNSGLALFSNGERSNAVFKLWEVPVDLSLGLEIPITSWFKIAGAAGPSAIALIQNRDDLISGEKGKNKLQVSHGQFANAQFKINISRFSQQTAYDLFTSSRITNLFLNFEARYQKYQNFQDIIKISGTSYGVGFTFEYL